MRTYLNFISTKRYLIVVCSKMEKLVIVYHAGDGYECSYTAHVPVAYESAEALLVHLEEAIVKRLQGGDWCPPVSDLYESFTFSVSKSEVKVYEKLGFKVFKVSEHFYRSYELPEVLTLEEWFNQYMVNKNG